MVAQLGPPFTHEDEFCDGLMRRAKAKQAEWRALLEQRQELDRKLEALKRYIASLNSILQLEGLPTIEVTNGQAQRVAPRQPRPTSSGQTPPRREAFRHMTLPEAVRHILTTNGSPMHADELVEAIFEISSRADFKAAKQNLGSTLSRKAAEGLWQRGDQPNTYRI